MEGPPESSMMLIWDAHSITSKGWSGSILLSKNANSVFVEQIRAPSQYSNEIHVLWPVCR